MKQKTMGRRIADMRKEKGMTQQELAEEMGVTDKAVSKWERDLSCPDIATVPKLAALFGVSTGELLEGREEPETAEKKDVAPLVRLILKAVALAMGVAVTVLSAMKELDAASGAGMLGVGLACLAASALAKQDED